MTLLSRLVELLAPWKDLFDNSVPLSTSITTLHLLALVVGGGLAQAPHALVTLAEGLVGERATFHRVPPIVPATLGGWAGANGCVLLGLQAG